MKQKQLRTFKELIIWQSSHKLVLSIYKLTDDFPQKETYGVTSQLRRCVVSVPANIAEGFGRKSDKEFAQYLKITLGSIEETHYFIILGGDLGYIDSKLVKELEETIDQIKIQFISFINLLDPRTLCALQCVKRRTYVAYNYPTQECPINP